MWRDTPDQVGLLVAAQMEAEVAAQHAGLAAGSGDLAGIQRHIVHVLHAIDPTTSERGPGKGYGLIRAASGAAQHIELAAGVGRRLERRQDPREPRRRPARGTW